MHTVRLNLHILTLNYEIDWQFYMNFLQGRAIKLEIGKMGGCEAGGEDQKTKMKTVDIIRDREKKPCSRVGSFRQAMDEEVTLGMEFQIAHWNVRENQSRYRHNRG